MEALQATGWNKSETARRLGMRRTTLLHRLHALAIPLDPLDETGRSHASTLLAGETP
ncbi:MAG: hypothetical protein KGI56_07790 [Acidobacteriota bacterium]|nr:hypothetical protein [Acidobacteriota bacterium]